MTTSNVKYFSATEQIENISAKNVENCIKKNKKNYKITDFFNLINVFDNKIVDNKHIYPNILIQWKLEQYK